MCVLYTIIVGFFLISVAANAQSSSQLSQASEEVISEIGLGSFLDLCKVFTLHTQCTEDEYENNEDCLPQKKDTCDRSKDLFCHAGVCLPNCHPSKEKYDPIDGKCFRKVDSDCRTGSEGAQTLNPSYTAPIDNADPQTTSLPVVPSCERNAVCEKGICKCEENYSYDPTFGKCMRSASYATFCNSSIACDRKSDIYCTENQCQCKSPSSQYYHLKRKRCYVLLGEVCSNGLQFCPDNSNCLRHETLDGSNWTSANHVNTSKQLRRLYGEYQSGRYTTEGEAAEDEHFIGIWGDDEDEKKFVCKCEKGYSPTRDKRFCQGLHKTRCNTLHRCNPERGLKCIDDVCLCSREKGHEQVFSEQFQTCITRIGSSCEENADGDETEPDICPIGGLCAHGKCICEKGLTPLSILASLHPKHVAYSCVKSYGMECNNSGSSYSSGTLSLLGIDPFEPPCNHEIGLECNTKEKKCLCRDNQFYDTRLSTCRDFQRIDSKIPIVHFTPPDDREYNFKKAVHSGGNIIFIISDRFNFTIFLVLVYLCRYM